MSVELGPRGTKGVECPKAMRPLMNAMMGWSNRMFRILGSRMKIQGTPLLLLKTVGAKTDRDRGQEYKVTPEPLKGAERDEAWRMVVSTASGYGGYETKTYRQIPIIRLIPVNHSKEDLKGAQ